MKSIISYNNNPYLKKKKNLYILKKNFLYRSLTLNFFKISKNIKKNFFLKLITFKEQLLTKLFFFTKLFFCNISILKFHARKNRLFTNLLVMRDYVKKINFKKTLVSFIFKLRNLFLTLNVSSLFFSFSTGIIAKTKNCRNNLKHQFYLLKYFFLNLDFFFKKNITLQFNRQSAKIELFFDIIFLYIDYLNEYKAKKNYFLIKEVKINNRYLNVTLKYKKKPRRKKIFSKKSGKYLY